MNWFESIQPLYTGYGLCLPGVGIHMFQQAGTGLLQILAVNVFPMNNLNIASHFEDVTAGDSNGFTLLWNIGILVIPISKRTETVPEPV